MGTTTKPKRTLSEEVVKRSFLNMPKRIPTKRELLENYPETIKHYQKQGAARVLITERCIVFFDEKGSSLKSINLSKLDRIESSFKRESYHVQ